ncbi:hypothetical protein [Cellulosimicrobium cellulans]|uniref:hypothetical protein n=1 Tax=Cellulosimicrobium cellulans TaxID=1710 RepID=UPI00130DA2BF|nr:hypothetical protein [Cellulosimicrobium cellulans]
MPAAPRRRLATLLTGMPRAWVAVLLVVAALDLAVVVAGTGTRTAEAATGIAPLVAGIADARVVADGTAPADGTALADGTAGADGAAATRGAVLADRALVADGALVADDVVLATDAHALVVDRAAEAASVPAPGDRDALVLAGDGLALLVGGERWTVAYAGSLTAADLHALLAGWEEAQRGTALLAAVLTGALTVALATAVLALGARYAGRLARGRQTADPRRAGPSLPPRDALAWWAASLAAASTAAAAVVLATGGATGRTPTLAATLVAATTGVCLLAATARTAPDPPSAPAALTSPAVVPVAAPTRPTALAAPTRRAGAASGPS